MYCEKVTYKNYRNISGAEITFSNGVNILYGNNAQGKTNIIEGIFYFAYGKSFRGVTDKELIKFGENYGSLRLEFSDGVRKRTHDVELFSKERKILKKEGIKISKVSEFIGNFKVVLFNPEHLFIVKGSPSERRSFLDMSISQIYPEYMTSLMRYNKILSQRNCVLKNMCGRRGNYLIDVLSSQLAQEAAFISLYRSKYTKKLSEFASMILSDMTGGKEKLNIEYKKLTGEEEYLKLLTSDIQKESVLGCTMYGVHKDDLIITLNGSYAKNFASQGQQRSIAFAMKLAEGEILKSVCGEHPVFLLDDILSELDSSRKNFILSGLTDRQVIITGCETVPNGSAVFTVKEGGVTQC